MDGSRRSRREVLRGATGAVAGLGFAGCLDRIPVLGSGSTPSVGPVPATATAFATADVAALLDADPLRALLDDAVPATDVNGLAAIVEGQVGLDPREIEQAVGFATPAEGVAGAVIDTGWSTTEVVSAIESQNGEATETTVGGRPAYTFEETGLTVGTLEDGRHVVGVGGGVRAVVATDTGSNDAVRPAVRRAYGRVPSGPVTFAIDATAAGERTIDAITRDLPRFSRDVVDSVRFVAGSLSTVGDRPRVVMQVTGDDGTGARQLKEYAEAIPVLLEQRVDDEVIGNALDDAEISRDGTRVTIALEGHDTVQPLINAAVQRMLFAVSPVSLP
ncbi:hypothetical protein [Halapricum hydrolyticum]|uniref:Uncharacterized protein n=1 Tax=Halapricum hydrolyticum TaxID=2979991 RepID=A0AAE3IBG8_9EURY|nr:hypothetical protein [Halapricum hydrolyticum]MCU4717216.1 hypothetical protein [Halapricum hydrolyticum]MCU4726143.1 hypothetical protein [Halapricum hydrolyticum]